MDPLRVAVVGAGLMGGWHARYAVRAGARVAAVVDERPEAAGRLARRFPGARAFADLGICLRETPAEIVHVCTRLESHVALAEIALQAGRHVLVEKPAAASADAARMLLGLARDRGLQLAAVHQLPFQAGFQRLRERVARLGEIVRIDYVACTAGADGLGEEARCAVLLEILPHPFSLLWALMGASLGAESLVVERFTTDELELRGLKDGARLGIAISLRARPTRNDLTVMGTRLSARVDLFHGFGVFESAPATRMGKLRRPFQDALGILAAATGNLGRRALRGERAYPGLLDLVRRFYGSVRSGTAPPVSGEELLESVRLVEAVSRSAGSRRRSS